MKMACCAAVVGISLALSGLAVAGTLAEGSPRPVRSADNLGWAGLDESKITSGILYDLVVPLSRVDRYDGGPLAGAITLPEWKQAYSEMWRASLAEPAWPAPGELDGRAGEAGASAAIRLALMNFRFDRIRPGAFEEAAPSPEGGRLADLAGELCTEQRLFALAPLKPHTYRGSSVVFALEPAWYFTNDARAILSVEIDFGDRLGFRPVALGERRVVEYLDTGAKVIRARVSFEGGAVLEAACLFEVRALETPVPDDTLSVTATVPYLGSCGTGKAYVYLSDGHSALTNPVLVVEGFDLDNDMNWEELYALLNQEGLAESLRADGFDAVVLNFADATDYIQRNTFVATALIEQLKSVVGPYGDIAIVGASMGGVIARYALAYLEANQVDHQTRTLISFDSPQKGANIPLGLQYWVMFFSGESEGAAYMLDRLNTPAARQLLAYHMTDPPGSTGQPDPLRTVLLADLAAVGDYPAGPRKVAVANGSGAGAGQGYGPGAQVIFYEYDSFLVDIRGNVWAVPDGGSQMILEGLIDRIWPLSDDEMDVWVSGTDPYDSAPGGWRASMTTMDTTDVPYGDIVALYPSHCFIPTVSALALDSDDLLYDIAGDPDLLAHTPFDTLYFPAENQEHVSITSESALWFRAEIGRGDAAAVEPGTNPPAGGVTLAQDAPNPFASSTAIRLSVPRAQRASLAIYDVAGRVVAGLLDDTIAAGVHRALWDGRDDFGRQAASGIYFCRLATPDGCRTLRMVLLR